MLHDTQDGKLEFGPIFNKTFLLAVRDLQNEILEVSVEGLRPSFSFFSSVTLDGNWNFQLGQDDGKGLQRICYAPVRNDFTGPTTVDLCTVQSVWGYFQNDLDKFEKTDVSGPYEINYLDHLYKCAQ